MMLGWGDSLLGKPLLYKYQDPGLMSRTHVKELPVVAHAYSLTLRSRDKWVLGLAGKPAV